jgi:antitoxin MazE
MESISTSELRSTLASTLNNISSTNGELIVTGAGRDPIVITSKANFNNRQRDSKNDMFSLARLQIIQMASTQINFELVSEAYLFAWLKGVYPMLHDSGQGELRNTHQFCSDNFIISHKIVETISACLDNKWDDAPTFYELEKFFDSRSRLPFHYDRASLILTCRYLYLSDGFYPDFWGKLLTPGEHPSEASIITNRLSKDEVTL